MGETRDNSRRASADCRVVVMGQPARGDQIKEPNSQQPLADRAKVGRTALDECLEGGLSHFQRRRLIERQPFDLVDRPAVAEQGVEVANPCLQRRVGRRRAWPRTS